MRHLLQVAILGLETLRKLAMSTDLPIKRGHLLVKLRKQTSCPKRIDFCKKYGIPLPTMKAWESGVHEEISGKGIKKLVEAFQNEGVICDANYILNAGLDLDLPFSNANKLIDPSELACPNLKKACSQIIKLYDGLQMASVTDDSLLPLIKKGDVVIGKPPIVVEHAPNSAYGTLNIIESTNGNLYVMFLEKTNLNNIFLLRAHNFNAPSVHLSANEIKGISPVIFIARPFEL